MQTVSSHLAQCELCRGEQQRVKNLFQSVKSAPEPDKQLWQNLAVNTYRQWQQQKVKKQTVSDVINEMFAWLRHRPSFALAGAGVLMICIVAVLLYPVFSTPAFDIKSFHNTYVKTSPNIESVGPPNELKEYVLGFSIQTQSSAFAVGAQVAKTYQACYYFNDEQCKQNFETLKGIIDHFPYRVKNITLDQSANIKKAASNISALDTVLQSKLISVNAQAEQFLYQLGGWTFSMSFAAHNKVTGISKEKIRVENFLTDAQQYNLAKGVIQSLENIRDLLQNDNLTDADFANLNSNLTRINQILL